MQKYSVTHHERFNSIKSSAFSHYSDSVAEACDCVCLIPHFFFFTLLLFLLAFLLISTESLSVCGECSVLAPPLYSSSSLPLRPWERVPKF